MENRTNGEEKNVNGIEPPSTDASKTGNKQDGEQDMKKKSKIREIYGKLGLDVGTILLMFKGSVAPTIAIAIYQADSVSYCWWYII